MILLFSFRMAGAGQRSANKHLAVFGVCWRLLAGLCTCKTNCSRELNKCLCSSSISGESSAYKRDEAVSNAAWGRWVACNNARKAARRLHWLTGQGGDKPSPSYNTQCETRGT